MRFRGVSKFRAKPVYLCSDCGMQWAAIPPEKTLNSKGKLTISEAAKLKARTCPSCDSTDSIFFASKREAQRYRELELAERSGLILDIELQPKFEFPCDIAYKADFAYTDAQTGKRVVEDVKGVVTPEFKLKMKLLAYFQPEIEVNIVK